MPQDPIQITCSNLFTPGRACAGPTAVVLHEWKSGFENLGHELCRCLRPRPLTSPGCHTSYHYGIGGNCLFQQYVADADTAWGFYFIPTPACPTPPCPIEQTCDGIGADQYNPELDGTLAVPSVVAGPDGSANCSVIHVAIATGAASTSSGIYCIGSPQFSEFAYRCLVQSLCYIFETNALVPDGYVNLLTHVGELVDLDLDQLAIDIQECLDFVPPPLPPCDCAQTPITAVDTSSINLTAAGVDSHTLSGVVLVSASAGNTLSINPDGLFVPTPVDTTIIVGLDTTCIDTTAVEGPADTWTISSVPIISPDAGNQLACSPNGLLVPAIDAADFCGALALLPTGANIGAGAVVLGADCELHALEFPVSQAPLADCEGNAIGGGTQIVTEASLTANTQIGGALEGLLGVGAIDGCPVYMTPPSCIDAGVFNLDLGNHLTLGATADGQDLGFYRTPNPVLTVAGGALDIVANYANGTRIFLVDAAAISLTNPPFGPCLYKEIWVKNISAGLLTITSIEGIDGQPAITLQGQVAGGYPYGNNGGESVHLVWSDANLTWFIL